MHFVVVDTHRFLKISRRLYCSRRYCNIYLYLKKIIINKKKKKLGTLKVLVCFPIIFNKSEKYLRITVISAVS